MSQSRASRPSAPAPPTIIQDYNDIFVVDARAHKTRNIMTKYEKTAVLSLRLQQLARGAPPCVDTAQLSDMRAVALEELAQGKLPFVVVRSLPDDTKEYWKIRDLTVLRD